MLDERMDRLYGDSEWTRLNQPDFKYGNGGENMRTSGVGELSDKVAGILTPYSQASSMEDKAELFAHMIVDGPYVRKRMETDPILTAKVALIKKRLEAYDPGLGPDLWKQVPGWQ
jgi:hypothetical protein